MKLTKKQIEELLNNPTNKIKLIELINEGKIKGFETLEIDKENELWLKSRGATNA